MSKLLVICGPTATGKTRLAAWLAKKLNGELISADSRQVYRGNDLETNKERPDVPIWLYDVVDPEEEFSVSTWVKLARTAIGDISKLGKLPIVVGGTGLYIKALISPFETIDIPPNKKLREKNLSLIELQKMVRRGNMNNSDWNNPRRLIRKIEIAKSKKSRMRRKRFDYIMIGLTAPLPILHKRIDDGIEKRMRAGMNVKPEGERAIAKRQLTWFKKQKGIHWFDISQKGFEDAILKLLNEQN